ncbi:MAG: type II toxin-antitoxin system prevent-host-death family antitoxin [Bryobacteraceae bacterium]|jgi:prevent-host-death family protein
MVIRNISEAKAQLSALIAMVERGDEVILARSGKPVVKIVPYGGATRRRVPGSMEGEIRIAADFDQLPDDMAEAFGMVEPGK